MLSFFSDIRPKCAGPPSGRASSTSSCRGVSNVLSPPMAPSSPCCGACSGMACSPMHAFAVLAILAASLQELLHAAPSQRRRCMYPRICRHKCEDHLELHYLPPTLEMRLGATAAQDGPPWRAPAICMRSPKVHLGATPCRIVGERPAKAFPKSGGRHHPPTGGALGCKAPRCWTRVLQATPVRQTRSALHVPDRCGSTNERWLFLKFRICGRCSRSQSPRKSRARGLPCDGCGQVWEAYTKFAHMTPAERAASGGSGA